MKKIFIGIMLLMLVITGCQGSAEVDSAACKMQLSDLELLDLSGLEVVDIKDYPFSGTIAGQQSTFDSGTLTLSRYASAEAADEALTKDSIIEAFDEGTGITLVTDAPLVVGDETVWFRLQEGSVPIDAALVRYSDYLMVINPHASSDIVKGMLGTVNDLILDYIDANPDCAYLHPDTR